VSFYSGDNTTHPSVPILLLVACCWAFAPQELAVVLDNSYLGRNPHICPMVLPPLSPLTWPQSESTAWNMQSTMRGFSMQCNSGTQHLPSLDYASCGAKKSMEGGILDQRGSA
jgi:hypothetical protein